jgi:hypothetical protein
MVDRTRRVTLAEAADEFGVTPNAVRAWIDRGIIPSPPSIVVGLKTLPDFTPGYMKQAKRMLDEHRAKGGRRHHVDTP